MTLTVEQVYVEALSLPARNRAELIERLSTSLEDTAVQEKIDDAWAMEIGRRCKAFEDGKMTARPVEEVMNELYASLKK